MTCSALRWVTEERCLPGFSNVLPPSDTVNVSRSNSISKELWCQMSSARTWQPRPWRKENAVFRNLLGEANDWSLSSLFAYKDIVERQLKNVTCLNVKCKREKTSLKRDISSLTSLGSNIVQICHVFVGVGEVAVKHKSISAGSMWHFRGKRVATLSRLAHSFQLSRLYLL